MGGQRLQGPMCVEAQTQSLAVDEGTMCRQQSSLPGPAVDMVDAVQPHSVDSDTVEPPSELVVLPLTEFANFLASTTAQAFTPIRDTMDLRRILNEMGFAGKAILKTYKGKEYVVLSGYAGLRKILTGTRYQFNNVKVVDMVIGKAGIAKSVVKGTAWTIVLVAAADVLEAVLSDEETLRDDLGFTITVNLSKAAVSGLASLVTGLALTATGVACAPLAGAIFVGVAVGLALDHFTPTDEIVSALKSYIDQTEREVQSFLGRLEREILWRLWPHDALPFPY